MGLSRRGVRHRLPCFCVYLRGIPLAVPLFFNCPSLVCFAEFPSTYLLKIKIKTFLIVLCFLIEVFRPFTFNVKLDTSGLIFPILLFGILCSFFHFPLRWRGGQCITPSLLVPEYGHFTKLFRSITVPSVPETCNHTCSNRKSSHHSFPYDGFIPRETGICVTSSPPCPFTPIRGSPTSLPQTSGNPAPFSRIPEHRDLSCLLSSDQAPGSEHSAKPRVHARSHCTTGDKSPRGPPASHTKTGQVRMTPQGPLLHSPTPLPLPRHNSGLKCASPKLM